MKILGRGRIKGIKLTGATVVLSGGEGKKEREREREKSLDSRDAEEVHEPAQR